MKMLLIDPPVTPLHPPAEIEAWIEELGQMREKYAQDRDSLVVIDFELARAKRWLKLAEEE